MKNWSEARGSATGSHRLHEVRTNNITLQEDIWFLSLLAVLPLAPLSLLPLLLLPEVVIPLVPPTACSPQRTTRPMISR